MSKQDCRLTIQFSKKEVKQLFKVFGVNFPDVLTKSDRDEKCEQAYWRVLDQVERYIRKAAINRAKNDLSA